MMLVTGGPQPELVLLGVEAIRWRLPDLLSYGWPEFERRLDSLIANLRRARGDEAIRLTRSLIDLGLDTRARELFAAVEAHAHSPQDMDRFRRSQDDAAEAHERHRRAPPAAGDETLLYEAGGEAAHRGFGGGMRGEYDTVRMEPGDEGADRTRTREAAIDRRPGNGGTGRLEEEIQAPTPTEAFEVPAPAPRRATPSRAVPARKKGRAKPAVSGKPSVSPQRRHVNVNFANVAGRTIPRNKPLVADRDYHVRIDIGPYSSRSIVANPSRGVVHAELLPKRDEGHWLEVIAVSSDFTVSPKGHWLFLPVAGAAWHCQCKPGRAHKCRPADRRVQISIPVRSPKTPGKAELRLTVYFERSVVQSMLVRATVRHTSRERGSTSALVDYNLTNRLTDLADMRPRALSVMMNRSEEGTHKLIFNGARDAAVWMQLTDGQLTDALKMMREVMRGIHIDDRGPRPTDKANRFDDRNAKPREAFIADLRTLAGHGWQLWAALWQGQERVWKKGFDKFVGGSDVIQIARKAHSTAVFPWAMVYSIPIETGDPQANRECRLLSPNEWRDFQNAAEVPERCPFEQSHSEGIICPYGFWGFRYEIEHPPSLQAGRTVPRSIPAEQPLDLMVGLSDELDQELRDEHLRTLRAQHQKFALRECHSRAEIKAGLALKDLELVYFYCHGYSEPLPGTAGTTPRLGVGRNQVIAPADLTAWGMSWADDHWRTAAPLVFINGCHTADTLPQTLVNFVDTFSGSLDAAGVIGTEITIHQRIANEVGQTFLDAFQRGLRVGKALRRARGSLLRKGNLLGLVYTAYCSADLCFAADCS